MKKETIFSFLILIFLSSCGLRSLYSSGDGEVPVQLEDIYISTIQDRQGQILRNKLLQVLTPKGLSKKYRYILKVTLRSEVANLGILKDATSSLTQYQYYADFSLSKRCSKEELFSGKAQLMTYYNTTPSSPFSTVTEAEFAKSKAVESLAYDIRRQLAAYFSLEKFGKKEQLVTEREKTDGKEASDLSRGSL